MLIKAQDSVLIVIDMQERLVSAMVEPDHTIKNTRLLLQVAEKTMVPALLTEQYPEGLGATISTIRNAAGQSLVLHKVHFSCMQDSGFVTAFTSLNRPQVILTGMEAHICVVQTAASLADAGYEVFVVSDAIASRTSENKNACLTRLNAAGVSIVTTEMVIFEWLGQAGTSAFKEILLLIKQHEIQGEINEYP
jgi:nicotinamidase-related amidase